MMKCSETRSRALNNKSPGNERCSLGVSILAISGLSALSWAVVILVGVAIVAVV